MLLDKPAFVKAGNLEIAVNFYRNENKWETMRRKELYFARRKQLIDSLLI